MQEQLSYLQERLKAQEAENKALMEAAQKEAQKEEQAKNQEHSLSALERIIQGLKDQN